MINFRKSSMVIILSILLVFLIVGGTISLAAGPASIDLGTSKNFAILSKTATTNIPSSIINGDVGASPITGAAIGLTCPEVTGTIYSVDAAGPLPCRISDAGLLTVAVNDMEAAYNNAAGKALPNEIDLNAGNIGGLTITPGLYKWSSDVNIATDLTLSGNATDVWVFQISGDLTIASAQKIILSGGANASNIFWQVGGPTGATLGTTSIFNGTILSAKQIILQTKAVLNGRALAQTQVTLDQNTINLPSSEEITTTPSITSTPSSTPAVEEVAAPTSTPAEEEVATPISTPVIEEEVVTPTPTVEEEVIVTPTQTPTVEEEVIITPTPTPVVEEEIIVTPTPVVVETTPNFPNAGVQEKNNTGIIAIIISLIALISISLTVLIKRNNV